MIDTESVCEKFRQNIGFVKNQLLTNVLTNSLYDLPLLVVTNFLCGWAGEDALCYKKRSGCSMLAPRKRCVHDGGCVWWNPSVFRRSVGTLPLVEHLKLNWLEGEHGRRQRKRIVVLERTLDGSDRPPTYWNGSSKHVNNDRRFLRILSFLFCWQKVDVPLFWPKIAALALFSARFRFVRFHRLESRWKNRSEESIGNDQSDTAVRSRQISSHFTRHILFEKKKRSLLGDGRDSGRRDDADLGRAFSRLGEDNRQKRTGNAVKDGNHRSAVFSIEMEIVFVQVQSRRAEGVGTLLLLPMPS